MVRIRSLTVAAQLFVGLLFSGLAFSQTTQGLISGQLVDSVSGRPIPSANVLYSSSTSNLAGASASDAAGYYYLPLLSPGFYQLHVTAPAYQDQEIQEIELTVAARVELDFRLRPLNDIWESGQYKSVFLPGSKTIVTFYGPDVDSSKSGSFEAQKGRRAALESTVSAVIDSGEINNLPLEGRDVYTMLVTQPGVSSDLAAGRGLGLSINGQRPSASNFLLDGVENNNYVITGPLVMLAPEAIQEYRVSTNNFSAEYGRTSGFVANAITLSGSPQFHGTAYFYLKNDTLNANGFQENRLGTPRIPDTEVRPGYSVGGPILRDRLFFSSALEYFQSRSEQDPATFVFPSTAFVPLYTSSTSLARQLLTEFPAPAVTNGIQAFGSLALNPPVALNRTLAIERMDYAKPNGKDRVMGRLLINRLNEPDFIWSPYKDFISKLDDDTWAAGFSYIHSFRPALTNEARFSYSLDDLHWDRPHPEIPTLVTGDGLSLPGSPAFYAYKNANKSWELLDNVTWSRGKHLITVGAGLLLRNSDGYLTAGRDGEYGFSNYASFGGDFPAFLRVSLDRTALPTTLQVPGFDRTYQYSQYFLFAQDTFKLTSRLTLNYGIRYEFYGGPQNTGATKDVLVQLGSGATLPQQLTTSSLVKPGSGDEQLFGSDKKDLAVRVGASYDLFGRGRTVLRGAYGTFYDRPFDNLWENLRNNNVVVPPSLSLTPGRFNYLAPIATVLSTLPKQVINTDFPDVTLVDPKLRNGYAKSYFVGVQHRILENLTAEVNGLGTYGRKLITTDVINRSFSTPSGRYNEDLPDIAYRANQGFSDYNALTAVLRYRSSRGMVQTSYTWSHMIDNQSDPLTGDFFDLTFTSPGNAGGASSRSTFSQQFNALADRGNSDFDQRHNLVIFSYWNLPAPLPNSKVGVLFRNWTVSELAAFRSGFPYTVIGATSGSVIENRPDIVNPNQVLLANPIAVNGGVQLLNPAGFAEAPPNTLGNEGRNAFRSPGFYSVDLSVARSFALRKLGEAGRLTLRADAFNVLNHANLGTPDALFTSPLSSTFGIANFGRSGVKPGFPALSPLNETPRQVQLCLKILF